MCSFFSFLADEKHNFYHFTHAQRLAKVTLGNGKTPLYDSHASIAGFYGISEDDCNKYEYNPFTDILTLDQQNMEENEAETLAFVHSINWKDFFGDIEGARKFIVSIKDIPFMQNNPDFDLSGCKVFDTRVEAYAVAFDVAGTNANNSARNTASITARSAVWGAVKDAARSAAMSILMCVTRDVTRDATAYPANYPEMYVANNMDEDIALYCVIHSICADLPIPQEHIDYINKRFAIWQNGYGVYGELNGVLYVYRRIV
ncbi:MAG: hypothetical protein RR315_07445 [Oscillospiraceae bacterium]